MEELNVNISEILDGHICENADGHYVCMLRYTMKPEDVKKYQQKKILNVKNDRDLLFCGYIYRTKVPVMLFEAWECTVVAYSAGILLDEKHSTYTYQNRSLKEIIETVCREYEGDCIIEDNESFNQKGFYIQHNETDWGFLSRVLSARKAEIRSDWKSEKPRLFIGEPLNLKSGRQRMAPLHFYNGACYDRAVGARGNRTLIRSGVTETLYEAAVASYNDDVFDIPAGWVMVDSEGLDREGFRAMTLRKNKSIIVAFAGTNDRTDLRYDVTWVGSETSQIPVAQARGYILRTFKKYAGYKIYITGHSLGGHMAIEAALYMLKLNQFDHVEQIEVFNGFGSRSNLGIEENFIKMKDKIFSREYRRDVISEYRKMIKNRILYDDKLYDKYRKVVTENKLNGFGRPETNIGAILGTEAYFSIKNHFISGFRQHFQYSFPLHDSGAGQAFRMAELTLKGKVLQVEGETFKAAFKEDRFDTDVKDAFVFHKCTPYVGAYMMPAAGDTVYIEFRFNSFDIRNPFETADCVRIERSGKK